MFSKSDSFSRFMGIGCCSCFGFSVQPQEHLPSDYESDDGGDYDCERTDISYAELQSPSKRSEQIILFRIQTGKICREFPVKETHLVVRSEDDDGNKMVNEYVREFKIGSGSYAKVVLYRSTIDGKRYAIKAFHKSHLLKQRVAPSETAMSDVLREVLIMKMLDHPNIVNLIEVMDDPNTDQFYMVLEYVEGKWAPEGSGASGGLEDSTVRKYLRDIVAGLMYLHTHDHQGELLIGSVLSYILFKLAQLNFVKTFMKMVNSLLPHLLQAFGAATSPFACISNSKHVPLGLDVSLPSFQDIKWNFGRLAYLFNMHLERNLGMFLIVLLVACFSFVLIGGFLFFKFSECNLLV